MYIDSSQNKTLPIPDQSLPCIFQKSKVKYIAFISPPIFNPATTAKIEFKACVLTFLPNLLEGKRLNCIFELHLNELDSKQEPLTKEISKKCLSVAKDPQIDSPYPGKPARFIHACGDWKLYNSGADLCRYMEFKSSTKDSLLKAFSVLGYRGGNVMIRIEFSKNSSEVADYFKQFDLILDWMDLEHGYKTSTPEQLSLVFNLIAENNEIPASHFEMIREIIAKRTHL